MRMIRAAGTRGDCDILACNLGAGECDSSRRGRDGERAASHRPGRPPRHHATPLAGCRDRTRRPGTRDGDAHSTQAPDRPTPQRLRRRIKLLACFACVL